MEYTVTAFFNGLTMPKIIYFFYLCLIFTSALADAGKVSVISAPKVLLAASKLPRVAKIERADYSYVFASVSQQYVNSLYPLLLQYLTPAEKHCLIKDSVSVDGGVAAHITLSDYLPYSENYLYRRHARQTYHFQPLSVKKVTVYSKYYKTTWYVLHVKSLGLTYLQKIFRVARKYRGQLHISIAKARETFSGRCITH